MIVLWNWGDKSAVYWFIKIDKVQEKCSCREWSQLYIPARKMPLLHEIMMEVLGAC